MDLYYVIACDNLFGDGTSEGQLKGCFQSYQDAFLCMGNLASEVGVDVDLIYEGQEEIKARDYGFIGILGRGKWMKTICFIEE